MSRPATLLMAIVAVVILALPGAAMAYVGPGAGLGMIGSLIAVLVAVAVAVVGIVILPIRLVMRRRKGGPVAGQPPAADREGA